MPSSVVPLIAGARLPTATWDVSEPGRAPTSSRMAAVVTTASARASRIGRRGIASAGYWSLAVPVMFGWTTHENV